MRQVKKDLFFPKAFITFLPFFNIEIFKFHKQNYTEYISRMTHYKYVYSQINATEEIYSDSRIIVITIIYESHLSIKARTSSLFFSTKSTRKAGISPDDDRRYLPKLMYRQN